MSPYIAIVVRSGGRATGLTPAASAARLEAILDLLSIGWTVREIADAAGITRQAVQNRLSEALYRAERRFVRRLPTELRGSRLRQRRRAKGDEYAHWERPDVRARLFILFGHHPPWGRKEGK